MFIVFLKDHPSSIKKGTVADYSIASAKRMIESGFAREAKTEDHENYKLMVDAIRAERAEKEKEIAKNAIEEAEKKYGKNYKKKN